MEERCKLLRGLLSEQASSDKDICEVLDYEMEAANVEMLEESPGYWAPKLPEGYLKTVPTARLLNHFATHNSRLQADANVRVGVVFGVDNMAGMVTWNRPGELLKKSDLIFVSRQMATVNLPKDPSPLLENLRYFELNDSVPVKWQESVIFGEKQGSFVNKDAKGDGAYFLLPELPGMADLSSTDIRKSVAMCASMLEKHGFPGISSGAVDLFKSIYGAAEARDGILSKATGRGELVNSNDESQQKKMRLSSN